MGGVYSNVFHDAVTHLVAEVLLLTLLNNFTYLLNTSGEGKISKHYVLDNTFLHITIKLNLTLPA